MTDLFIGRCKRCKLARRFVAPVVRETKHQSGRYPYQHWATERTRDVVSAAPFLGRQLSHGHDTVVIEHHDRQGAIWLYCPAGHQVEFKRMRGKVNDEPCSAKCTGATGNCCECSCGGKNHGAAHG